MNPNSGPWLRRQVNEAEFPAFLASQQEAAFTYPEPGATRVGKIPAGYKRDRYAITLGRGSLVFDAARDAVSRWAMFDLGWTRKVQGPSDPPVGAQVLVAIRYGVWWVNACRIVYRVDEPGRYGFAYGTLPGHVEEGEELFLVETTPEETVRFVITAFSRPRHWLARLGHPLVRRLQKRFGREACLKVKRLASKEAL